MPVTSKVNYALMKIHSTANKNTLSNVTVELRELPPQHETDRATVLNNIIISISMYNTQSGCDVNSNHYSTITMAKRNVVIVVIRVHSKPNTNCMSSSVRLYLGDNEAQKATAKIQVVLVAPC
jgi:hypothetical protein